MAHVTVAKGLYVEREDGPHLLGSRCLDCGTYAFPPQQGCQRCTGTNTETCELGNRGNLWTFTVQGFPPKSPPYRGNADPATFEAFGVGYVEIPGQVKVEARLTEADPAKLRIGMEMQMVLVPITTDADGNQVMTFAFDPIG
jgi:uncharacterized OB-fold protein